MNEILHAQLAKRDQRWAAMADELESAQPGAGRKFLMRMHDQTVEVVLLTFHREQGVDQVVALDFVAEVSGLTPEATIDALLRIGAQPQEGVAYWWRLSAAGFAALDVEYGPLDGA